jgi:hypothetical protein
MAFPENMCHNHIRLFCSCACIWYSTAQHKDTNYFEAQQGIPFFDYMQIRISCFQHFMAT